MKNKKQIIFLASSLTLGLSILPLSLKCKHKSPRFDQENDGIVKVASGFGASGKQKAALDALIERYNTFIGAKVDGNEKVTWEAVNKKAEGYMPVMSVINPNGYKTDDMNLKLSSKDKKGFYNLIANYPAAAAEIARYDMNLAFNEADYEQYGLAKAFKDVNKDIAFNNNNQKWMVPMSRSSEMFAVNQPVTGYFLNILKDKGAKIGDNHTLVDKIIAAANASVNDVNYIKSTDSWGEPTINAELEAKIKQFTLDDKIFSNYSDLIDFAVLVKSMFPGKSGYYVLGFDSLPNAVNAISSSLSKGDPSKNYIRKSTDSKFKVNGGYDFKSFYQNKNSEEYKLFEKSLTKIIEGINNNAIFVGGGGTYGSSDLTIHKLALSLGSTAGFSHTYVEKDEIILIKPKGTDIEFDSPLDIVSKEDGKAKAKAEYKANWDSAIAGITSGKYTNPVFGKFSTVNDTLKNDSYAYYLSDLLTSDEISEITAALTAGGVFIQEDTTSEKQQFSEENGKVYYTKPGSSTKIEIKNAKKYSHIFVNNKGKAKDDKYNFYYLPKTAYDTIKKTAEAFLNKTEVTHLSAPYKATGAAEETNSVFAQGPSFVGIHANEEEDKATNLFVKWFFTEKLTNIKIEKATYNGTPIDAFNIHASYVSPTESFFARSLTSDPVLTKLNAANKIAFENFAKANIDGEHYKIVEDVPSHLSNIVRSGIESAGKALVSRAQDGETVTFLTFIDKIKKSFADLNN